LSFNKRITWKWRTTIKLAEFICLFPFSHGLVTINVKYQFNPYVIDKIGLKC